MEDKNKDIMKQHPISKGEPIRGEAGISGFSPFGLGRTKPHHFVEMMGVAWENRDNLQYAWNILQHGVCDGCSLGPRGLQDDVIEGTHCEWHRADDNHIQDNKMVTCFLAKLVKTRKTNHDQLLADRDLWLLITMRKLSTSQAFP